MNMITLHYIDFDGNGEKLEMVISPACICTMTSTKDPEDEHNTKITLKNGTSFTVVEKLEEINKLIGEEK